MGLGLRIRVACDLICYLAYTRMFELASETLAADGAM